MAENTNHTEEFKTTLMGGYDKEDVNSKIKAVREQAYAEKSKLIRAIEERDALLAKKDEIITEKNAEIDRLRKDIEEKYQSYIDNYNTIGQLVYESRIRSERMINEARAERENILAQARVEAEEAIEKAAREVERKMASGRRKYNVLQEEISELIQLVNQVQHKFMQSFKAIHEISDSLSKGDVTRDYEYDENFEDTSEYPLEEILAAYRAEEEQRAAKAQREEEERAAQAQREEEERAVNAAKEYDAESEDDLAGYRIEEDRARYRSDRQIVRPGRPVPKQDDGEIIEAITQFGRKR